MAAYAVRDGLVPEIDTECLEDESLMTQYAYYHTLKTTSDDSNSMLSETDSQQSWNDLSLDEDDALGLFIDDTLEDTCYSSGNETENIENTRSFCEPRRQITKRNVSSPCEYSTADNTSDESSNNEYANETYSTGIGTFTRAAVVTGRVIRGTLLAPVYAVFGIICGPVLLAKEGAESASNIPNKILAGTMGAANGLVLGPIAGVAASFMDSFGISEPENERIQEYMMLARTSESELTIEDSDDDWQIVKM
ncbi:uncharacterized protein LOC144436704 [Glandiceps talaboti]